jgi:diaminohydroxyphosphoribosylaminopyrimidine deaminase/5-amino-6-(5-phosphoribosylamino)uracil reductase
VRTAREVPTTVITAATAPDARAARLAAAGVNVVRADSLEDGLRMLSTEGVQSLLVEGGGRLAGALLRLGLVDRYCWVQSPLWLGDSGVAAISGLPSEPIARADRWTVVERRALGEDTLLVLDRG